MLNSMSIVLAPCHCFTLRNFKQLQHSNMSSKQNNLQVTQLQPKTKCLHPQLQPKTKCLHQRVPTLKSAYILLKSLGQKGLAALQPHLLLCAFANSHIETATQQSAAQLELLFHFPRCHGALSFHSS